MRDPAVAHEVEQNVRELLRLQRPALPGDVDVGAGALRELRRADEGLHLVWVGERLRREEDAGELRMQCAHLLLHVGDVVVRDAGGAAERGVDVVVELPAVAGEVRDDDRADVGLELCDVDRDAARSRPGDEDRQLVAAEGREGDRELERRAAAWTERRRLAREDFPLGS